MTKEDSNISSKGFFYMDMKLNVFFQDIIVSKFIPCLQFKKKVRRA